MQWWRGCAIRASLPRPPSLFKSNLQSKKYFHKNSTLLLDKRATFVKYSSHISKKVFYFNHSANFRLFEQKGPKWTTFRHFVTEVVIKDSSDEISSPKEKIEPPKKSKFSEVKFFVLVFTVTIGMMVLYSFYEKIKEKGKILLEKIELHKYILLEEIEKELKRRKRDEDLYKYMKWRDPLRSPSEFVADWKKLLSDPKYDYFDWLAIIINKFLFAVSPKLDQIWSLVNLTPTEPKKLTGKWDSWLLPNPNPYYGDRLTLIMNPTFLFQGDGYYVAGRPGWKNFLEELQPFYEFVFWFDQDISRSAISTQKIIELIQGRTSLNIKIPPNFFFIYGDAGTRSYGSFEPYEKDLRYLNRSMRKVVWIDSGADTFDKYPENFLYYPGFLPTQNIPKEVNDLNHWIHFLKTIAFSVMLNSDDVRMFIGPLNRRIGEGKIFANTISAIKWTNEYIAQQPVHVDEMAVVNNFYQWLDITRSARLESVGEFRKTVTESIWHVYEMEELHRLIMENKFLMKEGLRDPLPKRKKILNGEMVRRNLRREEKLERLIRENTKKELLKEEEKEKK